MDRHQPFVVTPTLGEGFFDPVTPAAFPERRLRFRNQAWAARVGLGDLDDEAWLAHFGSLVPLPGNLAAPLALRYHGHQFRVYNPGLGDGRGFLYAQLRDPKDGRLLDLTTKGSGQTPWSRGGDGRLTLKGGVREVLATEMLEALGVYTSRSFSLVETGEALVRGDEPSPTRSSVLVRLCHGSVRFGTFERLARLGDKARMEALLDFCIAHYLPEAGGGDLATRATRFLREVSRRTASLSASWMAAGFVHGVLNTDNMSVTGESFDYGPYRFLPRYDPKFVAAYFDESGLYAYGRQPETVLWNLERLADALALLAPLDGLRCELVDFEPRQMHDYHGAFLERLGLVPRDPVSDALLVARATCFLEHTGQSYDRFFFDWYGGKASEARALRSPDADLYGSERFLPLLGDLRAYAPSHPDRLLDPYFAREGPCTLLIEGIESLWSVIAAKDDWTRFEEKIDEIRAFGRVHGHAAGAR